MDLLAKGESSKACCLKVPRALPVGIYTNSGSKGLVLLAVKPIEIVKEGRKAIRVKWEDGHESVYPNAYLRLKCRCASCVQEWTGEVMIKPEMIPSDIVSLKISPVGNYAIHIHWSDGHETGIYAFEMLREICPCDECVVNR